AGHFATKRSRFQCPSRLCAPLLCLAESDVVQGPFYGLPFCSLPLELGLTSLGQGVVLSAPPVLRRFPMRGDESSLLEAVQNGIQHAFRPFQGAVGRLSDPLDDEVPVALLLFKQGEEERSDRSGNKVAIDVHGMIIP